MLRPRCGREFESQSRQEGSQTPDAHTGIGHPDRQTPAPDAGHWTPRVDIAHLDTKHSHQTPDIGHRTDGVWLRTRTW